MASYQKLHIEKIHELIQYIVPKGHPFDPYTQDDMTLLSNHINSCSRDSLDESFPYLEEKEYLSEKMLDSLELEFFSPDLVLLKSEFLKH